ncbi:MAG: glutamate racemase [Kiritimatiellia bacterium]
MRIGFFDSGVGGLSVWREAMRQIPGLDSVYLADTAHCPYGDRPADFIAMRCHAAVRLLRERGCRLVVVACNTATAAAIDTLRASYPLPFVGMEPAVKPAALATKTGVVGVLATPGTLAGRLFRETSAKAAHHARVLVRHAAGWVEAVERGDIAPEGATLEIVRREVAPLLEAGADSLVLGCTHFPFLRDAIQAVAGPGVVLYDPSPAIARRILDLLPESGSFDGPCRTEFLSTGDPTSLDRMLRHLHMGSVPITRVAP